MRMKELEALVLSLQDQLIKQHEWATSEIAKRDAIIEAQAAKIVALEDKIRELTAQLKANSKNSSKPPSSDGLRKPAPKSLRTPSGKKTGGQKGHDGHGLKLKASIDHTSVCLPDPCLSCQNCSTCQFRVRDRRNVMDVKIIVERTEYQQMEVLCPCRNGLQLMGEFPEHVVGSKQYGPRLRALGAALVTECAVGLEKASQFLRGLTSCTISKSTILNFLNGCRSKLEDPMEYLRKEILGSPIACFDETGVRVAGKLPYLHNASTADVTYQTVNLHRGRQGMNAGRVLPYYKGIAIHDCLAAYWKYEGIAMHGVCCAHLLRECQGLHEMYPEEVFFRYFQVLLREMLDAKKKRIREGKEDAGRYYLKKYMRLYDLLISVGRYEHPPVEQEEKKRGRKARGKANAFVERVARLKEEVSLFFRFFDVPFDNNQAERDLRHAKVKMKVSGCFRTEEGAELFAKFHSFISTAKKRGRTALQALELLFQNRPMLALTEGD